MNETLDSALSQAYELIEANRIDEAREILQPLLKQYPDDADLWWVYAHSVDDPAEAQRALENVIRVDSNFTDAQSLLNEIQSGPLFTPKPMSVIKPIQPLPPKPQAIPTSETFDGIDDEDEFDDETEEPSALNRLILIGVLGLFVIIVILVLILSVTNSNRNQIASGLTPSVVSGETATPALIAAVTDNTDNIQASSADSETEAAVTATVTETEEVEVTDTVQSPSDTPTEESPSDTPEPTETNTPVPSNTPTETDVPAPTEDPVAALTMAFGDFELNNDFPVQVQTQLGETLLIEVCQQNEADDDMRETLLSSTFSIFADNIENIPDNLSAIGITLYDCESERQLRSIATDIDSLTAFSNGELNNQEFQLTWQPVG